jgi:hypothetical protein
MAKKDFDQLEHWRARLWKLASRAAKGQKGPAVVKALRRATIRLNELGMDDLYDKLSKADSTDGLYFAFDITWLAAFVDELKRPSKARRAAPQSK